MAGRPKVKAPSDLRSARTVLLLTPITKQTLNELAWKRRLSLNELANQIFESYIGEQKNEG